LQGAPLTIYGNGEQTRSFCYVSDIVEGLIRLMETDDEQTGPVNLGNPNEFTIRNLAERILSLTGSDSKVVWGPYPEDDPRQRCPDIAMAEKLLYWSPKVPIDEGLNQTIAYFLGLFSNMKCSSISE